MILRCSFFGGGGGGADTSSGRAPPTFLRAESTLLKSVVAADRLVRSSAKDHLPYSAIFTSAAAESYAFLCAAPRTTRGHALYSRPTARKQTKTSGWNLFIGLSPEFWSRQKWSSITFGPPGPFSLKGLVLLENFCHSAATDKVVGASGRASGGAVCRFT